MARVICHTCKTFVCTKCLLKSHRIETTDEGMPYIEMHEYEQIDDFVDSAKQTVWMINNKL